MTETPNASFRLSNVLLLLCLSQAFTPAYSQARTFSVNSTADRGTGSCTPLLEELTPRGPTGADLNSQQIGPIRGTGCTFREAIIAANNHSNANNVDQLPDQIIFSIPISDPQCNATTLVCTITPRSPLPSITKPVIIDAYTQPGAERATRGGNAAPKIELNGTLAGHADGLFIQGGHTTVEGLVINRFDISGIALFGEGDNVIAGNFIGTNSAGNAALGNKTNGVAIYGPRNVIGGTLIEERNLISGNGQSFFGGDGILIDGNGAVFNQVQGNLIGTNLAGTAALGNVGNGVAIFNALNNQIGEATMEGANLISGNGLSGVFISGDDAISNAVQGNSIGTDISGSRSLGNGWNGAEVGGVSVGGAHNSVLQNLISGNEGYGVVVQGGFSNSVNNNKIGTDSTATLVLGNAQDGVGVFPNCAGCPAGGAHRITSNTIHHNGRNGVTILGSNGNRIRQNSIYLNGRLGIDLGLDGVSQNEFSGSHNRGQHSPFISIFSASAEETLVRISLSSAPTSQFSSQYSIDFYVNENCDPTGFGEGEKFLDSRAFWTDRSGNFSFLVPIPPIPVGSFLTATATSRSNNDTSEFSGCFRRQ